MNTAITKELLEGHGFLVEHWENASQKYKSFGSLSLKTVAGEITFYLNYYLGSVECELLQTSEQAKEYPQGGEMTEVFETNGKTPFFNTKMYKLWCEENLLDFMRNLGMPVKTAA